MDINAVVTHLREHCPLFSRRVGAGLDLDAVLEGLELPVPSASAIFAGDDAEPNRLQTGVMQDVVDELHILAIVANVDEPGQAAVATVSQVRAELLRALAGWCPGERYEPLEYRGSDVVKVDRARAYYLFRFVTAWQLGGPVLSVGEGAETWPEVELPGLAELRSMSGGVDFINPGNGPDGRIEHEFRVEFLPEGRE